MRRFRYTRGLSLEDSFDRLTDGARPLAGGTDLIPLLKADLVALDSLVDIKRIGLPEGIAEDGAGLRIGALCTLTALAGNTALAARFPLLREAVLLSATPQIRNRATVGGNLLQRPRCWYFRDARQHCWLKGGADCLAVEGRNSRHALFGDSPCRAVHPSDLAGCLLALDARVALLSPRGERSLALAEFLAPPQPGRRRETLLEDNELLVQIEIPPHEGDWTGTYRKAMDRQAWDFALAGIAVMLKKREGRIEDVRVVGNGLAAVPWRLRSCEDALRDSLGDPKARETALAALDEGARPLAENAYKLDLAQGLLKQALDALL